MSKYKTPLISIITVVYNNKIGLEETIKSMISQSYKNFEYIVIDGASTDGTLDIITKYNQYITTYISEPDKGIYDAMNKGIDLAKGEYIYFLNSSDTLYNDLVLEEVASTISQIQADIYYGNVELIYPNFNSLFPSKGYSLENYQAPPHQGTFVTRQYILDNKFDTNYKSSADFEFFCKAQANNRLIHCCDTLIAKMPSGGFSSNKNIHYPESYSIIKKYFGRYYAYSFYFRKIILEQGIKKILITLRLNFIYQYLLKIKLQKQK